MDHSGTVISWSVRKFLAAFSLAILLACSLREPFLRPDSVKILAMLGKPGRFSGGPPCASPMEMTEAFLTEIGRNPAKPLVETAPKFALRASKICPSSRPVLNTENDVDFKSVAPLLGGATLAGDGRVQMEPWLWLRVIGGKVVGLEFQLDQV